MSNDITTASWRKSTHSGGQGGDCVELADLSPTIAVRDSKHPDGPILALTRTAFGSLTRQIRGGHDDS